MDIKVGEYVRTKSGHIHKVLEISPELSSLNNSKKRIFSHKAYYLDRRNGSLTDQSISKHSENIIDLIEVRDYVNGRYVQKITSQLIYFRNCAHTRKDSLLINDIVTHGQFENMKYIVGGRE